jgi:hypothetical protein
MMLPSDLTIENSADLHDPAGGGGAIESSWLRPDPLAIYFHAIAIIDATRVIDRFTRWQRISAVLLLLILCASVANVVTAIFAMGVP